jgi:hypothetical protein
MVMISDSLSECVLSIDRQMREFPKTYAFVGERLTRLRNEMDAVRSILDTPPTEPASPEDVIGAREAIAEVLPMIQRVLDDAQISSYCRANKPLTAQQVFDMAESVDSDTLTTLAAVSARLRMAVPGGPAIKAADVPL